MVSSLCSCLLARLIISGFCGNVNAVLWGLRGFTRFLWKFSHPLHPLSSEVRSACRSVSTLLRKVGFADRVCLRGASVKVAARKANFLTRVVREIQATAWNRRQPSTLPNKQAKRAVQNPRAKPSAAAVLYFQIKRQEILAV
jgi:hypothetical protein